MKILFVIEHADRELYLVEHIALLCESRGYQVTIWSQNFDLWKILFCQFDIIFVPFAIRYTDFPINVLVREYKNAKFVSLNFEQVLHNANKSFRRIRDSFCKEKVIHLYYEEEFRKLLESCGVPQTNIIKTNRYANLSFNSAHELQFTHNKLKIFVVSSFSWAWYSDSKLNKKIELGYNQDDAYQYRNYAKSQIKEYFRFIDKITKNFDAQVVWRPHPSESCLAYEEMYFEQYGRNDNILFSDNYTAYDWIKSSDLLIGAWSTLLLDTLSVFPEKVVRYNPQKLPDYLEMPWLSQIPEKSENEVFAYIRSTLDTKNINKKIEPIKNGSHYPQMIADIDMETLLGDVKFKNTIMSETSLLTNWAYLARTFMYYILVNYFPILLNDSLKRDVVKRVGR